MMAELQLAKLGSRGIGWKAIVSIGLVVGILGLGVKAIWFDSTAYLVPTGVIPVGARLANETFKTVRMNLGQLRGQYLRADTVPKGFANQTLRANQLVPTSSVVAIPPESVARLVVTNKTQIGSGIRSGAEVSVWSAKRLSNNLFDAPKQLVSRAVVSKVIKGSAVFGGQSQQVEILVDPIKSPALLSAMASDSPIFLVARQ